ncbi:ribosome small subunit-dependent GTPase A [Streptococcus entericus]|uniref:ribosome small subunit-dependent GTPase A n=1 Tax=Streptococcus entericus TaxID=155680 RepID=UPI000380267C|nr:ribosome small subunit-dependent GTPase A [Streptococcus entericus]
MENYGYGLKTRSDQKQDGRLVSETRQSYRIGLVTGEVITVKKHYGEPNYVVGDLVQLTEQKGRLVIERLLAREQVVKKAVNHSLKDYCQLEASQILASNVDQLFILIALDQNFSLSKLERFILVFQQDGQELHVLLTKKDLCSQVDDTLAHLSSLYPHVRFTALSIFDDQSLAVVKRQLIPQSIGLMIGASGAGKSSLLNCLLGRDLERTKAVKKRDGKGKHTTTGTTLHVLEELDYCLIDSPGFKGIDSQEAVSAGSLFDDIVALADSCKFSDCQHKTEPGCAVKAAVVSGELSQEKLNRYHYQADNIKQFTAR